MIDPDLAKLRHRIDNIDNQIISLLAQRMDVVDEVAALKRANNEGIFIKSNREADMIKDIVSKLENRYPKSHIVAIWRKIIAAANLHEQKVRIGLLNPQNIPDYRYLINEYYSRDFAIDSYNDYSMLISNLESNKINIAILPIPKISIQDNWWQLLINSKIKIFAKLPFVKDKNNNHELFCLAIKDVKPSYSDRTILYLESLSSINQETIKRILKDNKINSPFLLTQYSNDILYDVDGYYDERSNIMLDFKENNFKATILGHYATPIDL